MATNPTGPVSGDTEVEGIVVTPLERHDAIADKPHISIDATSGKACGYQPIGKAGAFTLGGKGCADLFNHEASAGIGLTFAPKDGIIGPVKSATIGAEGVRGAGYDDKVVSATVEVATPIRGVNVSVGAEHAGGKTGPVFMIGKSLQF